VAVSTRTDDEQAGAPVTTRDGWLRVAEAAGLLGVSLNTLRRWTDAGRLVCYRSPGGHRRYRAEDIESLLEQQALGAGTAGQGPAAVTRPPIEGERAAALSTIAAAAAGTFRASSCVVAVCGANATLVVAASHHIDQERSPFLVGSVVPIKAMPLASLVLQSGRTSKVDDLQDTGAISPADAAYYRRILGMRSVLTSPLPIAGTQPAGVLVLFDSRKPRHFTDADVALAEHFAAQAAVLAVSPADAGLIEERVVPDSCPVDAADAQIASRGLPFTVTNAAPDLDGALASVCRACGSDGALYALRGDTLHLLAPATATGAARTPVSVAAHPLAAVALSQGRVCSAAAPLDDPPEAAAYLAERELAALTVVPLQAGGNAVGVLELFSGEGHAISEADPLLVCLTGVLGSLVAAHISRLALDRRAQDLAHVLDAGIEDGALLNYDAVLRSATRRMSELTRAPVADIYAVEGGVLRALVSYDNGRFDADWEGVAVPLARYPCSSRAVQTGQISGVVSLDDPVLTPEARFSLEKWGYQSQLSVPLMAGGRIVGLAELSDYVPRDFGEDLDLIRGLAQAAAGALENARLFEGLERRDRASRDLLELEASAASSPDAHSLFSCVAHLLLVSLGAERCEIFHTAGDRLHSLLVYEAGRGEVEPGPVLSSHDYPFTAAALEAREPLTIADPSDERLTEKERQEFSDAGYESEAIVPLIIDDEAYGFIDLFDRRPRDWTEHMDFLRGAGQAVQAALRNVLLVDEVGQRSRILRDIVELGALAVQARDIDAFLHAVAQRLVASLHAAACDIFTLEGERLRVRISLDEDGADATLEGKLIGLDLYPTTRQALTTGAALVVQSTQDPRLTAEELENYAQYGYQSELGIPLAGSEGVIGFIDLFDTSPRDYSEYIDYTRSVGQIVAGALQGALLMKQLEQHATAVREMADIGVLASSAHELRAFAEAVATRVKRVAGVAMCEIYLARGQELRFIAGVTDEGFERDWEDVAEPLGLYPTSQTAIEQGRVIAISDLDDQRLGDYERTQLERFGMRSELCVPLVVGGRTLGVIDMFDTERRDWAPALEFASGVAHTVAGAMENVLLLDQLRAGNRDLQLLIDSALEFGSSLDESLVLHVAADRVRTAGGSRGCDIYRLEGDRIRVLATIDHGVLNDEYAGTTFAVTDFSMVEQLVRTKRPVQRVGIGGEPAATELERQFWNEWGLQASLKLPLLVRGEVVGLLSLFDSEPRTYENVELLQGLAQTAAQALANADIFQALTVKTREEEALNTLARRTAATLDAEEIARVAIEELRSLVDFDHAAIVQLDGPGTARFLAATEPLATELQAGGMTVDQIAQVDRLCREGATPVDVDRPGLAGLDALQGMRSVLCLALPGSEGAVGLLQMASARESAFSAEQRAVLDRVAVQLGLTLSNARLYERVKRLHLSNLKALGSALSAKDYYTLGHAALVAAYMLLIARELDWPPARIGQLEEAAYLHDIGKIGVSDRVLLSTGALNAREWELMRQHPVISAEIIEPLFTQELVSGVRHHHERYDGDGYPGGLAGDQIPIVARAMCVVDAYDAMSYRRPYREPLAYPECLAELERCSGSQFDPEMVAAFRRVLERLDSRRRVAQAAAAAAAARIDPDVHAEVTRTKDARSAAYASVAQTLRETRDAHPPTRFLCTAVRDEDRYVLLVDAEENEPDWSPCGQEIVGHGSLEEAFAGAPADMNVLYVDEYGVWVNALAPVRTADGSVVAVVTADVPPEAPPADLQGLRSEVKQSFASLLHTTAERLTQARQDAITDYLTGLYNHRYLHERLGEELERARERGSRVSLLFLDIDQFKSFNDRFGHSAGDMALRTVASVIDHTVRRVDMAARYGGEEFVIALIDTDTVGALEVAERIRQAVASARIHPYEATLSVSTGVATFPDDAVIKEELLDKADYAMYMAKRGGRNRVISFSGGQLKLDLDGTKQAAADAVPRSDGA
jgi:diguanylate cyclase (GGDEF)-like protein/excisionase family DNA binding protein